MNRSPHRTTPSMHLAARRILRVSVAAFAAAAPLALAEAPTAASLFARADTNGDGRLSRAEAERFPAVSERFERFDADRDGLLSPAEFEAAVNAPQ